MARGNVQHSRGLKAMLQVQHSTGGRVLGFTVLCITDSSIYSGLWVRITAFHPGILTQFTFPKDISKFQITLASCAANRRFPGGLEWYLCLNTHRCAAQAIMGLSSRFPQCSFPC